MRVWVIAAALALLSPTVAHASDPAQARFDAAADDAKAAMLVDPHDVIAKAQRAQALVASLPTIQARDVAAATLLWLKAEALLRIDDVDEALAPPIGE